jgi:hypothetical protein
MFDSPSRSVATARARVHSPAARCVRAAASARATAPVGILCRRQPERLLRELGRGGGGAALDRQPRRVVENGGNFGVRRRRRQREVTGAEERIFHDSRDTFMDAPPLVAEAAVKNGRQQRMGEANRPVLPLDHMRDECRVERGRRNARPLEKRRRRSAQCRGERERLARGRGESGDPRAHELFQPLGNREGPKRVDIRVENAPQLQREERISSRCLVDAQQCLAREHPAEAIAQEAMQRANAERSHGQPLDALRTKRLLESRRLRSVDEPPGEQQEYTVAGEPSQTELDRAGRRGIEPLDVVHRDQDRPAFAEKLQHVAHRHSDRAVINTIA